ncbi:MAG TPA: nodulation protein NfeD [Terriglobales bacterium]|nr:nodulation protein NfeD [Terriglobales bacterium]
MRTRSLLAIAAAVLCLSALSSADVLKIVIDDTIQAATAERIERALDQAAAKKDDAVLLELNTPGGVMSAMQEIMQKIIASPVPVIIYVTPSGSRAASAGFFILESADVAAMAPGTHTGAAHPVGPFGGDIKGAMGDKVLNDAAALMRSVVSKRGRNVEIAESTVRESKSYTDTEALSDKLIDYIAPNEQDLFRQIASKPVKRFNGQTVALSLAGEREHVLEPTLKEQIIGFLMDPDIAFIILAIGALALYTEFNHPGAVWPGTVGIVFILLALFALHLLPIRFAAVVLIFASFVLFALDAKFGTHGVLAVGGVATLVIGALLLVDSPIPQMRVKLATALAVSVPLGAITVFLMSIALRARRNKITTGVEGLVGEVGIAQTALAPAGKVFVHGEIWDAVATGNVLVGEKVVVQKVDGLQLKVDSVNESRPARVAGSP